MLNAVSLPQGNLTSWTSQHGISTALPVLNRDLFAFPDTFNTVGQTTEKIIKSWPSGMVASKVEMSFRVIN